MNIKKDIQKAVFSVVKELWVDLKIEKKEVEISYPHENFGDYSTNIAMKLAGKLQKNPLEIAEAVGKEIIKKVPEIVKSAEAQQPGFLNLRMTENGLVKYFLEIESQGDKYGFSNIGKGKRVMVEFGQPNTHKAFHVGHLRSAISGLAVTRLYELLGYKVIKVNYYGDVGMHVAKCTWAMRKNGLPSGFEDWNVHKKMELIDKMYVEGAKAFKSSPETEKEIRDLNKSIYAKNRNDDFELYKKIRDWSVDHVNDVFGMLGIEYDKQYPESEVFEDALRIVEKNKGGIFKKNGGAVIYDGEKDGLTTWVFLTSEGNPTYSAKDLALALRKFNDYKIDLSVITTSVEQIDYFKVIIHCLELIKPELKGKYVHVPFGWLLNEKKKTSSREGGAVKGVDVIEEARAEAKKKISVDSDYGEEVREDIIGKVAISGLKFLILAHEFHSNVNYNPKDFIKLKGYSGPFILYAYVRTRSILRRFEDVSLDLRGFGDIKKTSEEIDLMKKLICFSDVVEKAGVQLAPHLICKYIYELAQKFNIFYDKCSIKNVESKDIKKMRLLLVKSTSQVLSRGLWLLGIETPEKM